MSLLKKNKEEKKTKNRILNDWDKNVKVYYYRIL